MIVDTRDKPCPEPVLMTKNALESPIDSEITILVDNDISKENVIKFLTSNHLNYSVMNYSFFSLQYHTTFCMSLYKKRRCGMIVH